ncbi:MAG TPA: hypothetical protein IAC01_02645 [Candidatus Limicola stercorigallinarum]|nr:hypothetical protein [Candidatus Limicola stercorigallinarum]
MGRYEGTGRNHEGYRDPTAERAVRKVDVPLRDWRDYDAMRFMRYADGAPIEHGHVVHLPGSGDMALYRVQGFNTRSGRVVLISTLGATVEADPSEVSRW